MAINDGGPAAPFGDQNDLRPFTGFSKLEAYALAAMQGMVLPTLRQNPADGKWQGYVMPANDAARTAFDYAEAMLAEYERRKEAAT